VILIEYDPRKTSYEVLVNYAYQNMDPFDGTGQFCDRGTSYYPAIFYATESELEVVEDVLAEILELKGWSNEDIAAPILQRPVFWKAEDYHQDYYIKNPSNYGYYKNACGRPKRLKEVWGEEEYTCYHDEAHTCFIDFDTDSNTTTTTTTIDGEPGIVNADGELVVAESNIKNVDAETAGWLPRWAIAVLSTVTVIACGIIYLVYLRVSRTF
jgi:hypothetical protein